MLVSVRKGQVRSEKGAGLILGFLQRDHAPAATVDIKRVISGWGGEGWEVQQPTQGCKYRAKKRAVGEGTPLRKSPRGSKMYIVFTAGICSILRRGGKGPAMKKMTTVIGKKMWHG